MSFLLTRNYNVLKLSLNEYTNANHTRSGPPGNGTPSERQLLDAYVAEARRLIDATDEVRIPNPVSVYPEVAQNFTRAYEQSVFASDRTHVQMLNYAKAVSCLRLITVVKVGLYVHLCKELCTTTNYVGVILYRSQWV